MCCLRSCPLDMAAALVTAVAISGWQRSVLYRSSEHDRNAWRPLRCQSCRFVRETGFRALASMCGVMAGEALRADSTEMAEHLADGLCDSWSHVSHRDPVCLLREGPVAGRRVSRPAMPR